MHHVAAVGARGAASTELLAAPRSPPTAPGSSTSRSATTSRSRARRPRRCRRRGSTRSRRSGGSPGRPTQARLMTNVYVAAYRHPLETAKAFATLDHLSGGRVILGVGAGPRRGRVRRRSASRSPTAAGSPTRRSTASSRRGPTSTSATSGSGPGRRSSRARRSGSAARRSPRCGGSPSGATAGSRRARRRSRCPTSIAYLERAPRQGAARASRSRSAMITEYALRRRRRLGVPQYTRTGSPDCIVESLNEYGAMGVSHLQLRFAARSIDELCDQMAALRRRGRPAPHPLTARLADRRTAAMPLLVMRHDFRAPGVRPGVHGGDLHAPRWSSSAGPTSRAGTSRSSRSTTASTTAGCPRRSRSRRSIAGMTERIPILLSAVDRPAARPGPARRAARGARPSRAGGRVWTVVGAGYRPEEFEMAGVEIEAARQAPRGVRRRHAQGVDR